MALRVGDEVRHPRDGRRGQVIEIHANPACLMRAVIVRWEDGTVEELEELEFGPLED